MATSFGDYFKHLRLNRGKTLRGFCVENKFDPGNISRLEHGLSAPPREDVLKKYAQALGLRPNSADWIKFFALADTASGHIPKFVQSNKTLMAQLPVLFMTMNKRKLSTEQLQNIVELLKKRHAH
jgi:transcriptional regulator with XRE-family HTH domain